ncbi:MAG: hypothetical protein R3183_13105 [Oleiphilaceae bacterium]|nr:hypothetical protein [Oleiphilaceae bacterium]
MQYLVQQFNEAFVQVLIAALDGNLNAEAILAEAERQINAILSQ